MTTNNTVDDMARKAKALLAAAQEPDFLEAVVDCDAALGEMAEAVVKHAKGADPALLADAAETIHNRLVISILHFAEEIEDLATAIRDLPVGRGLPEGALVDVVRGYVTIQDLKDKLEAQLEAITGEGGDDEG